MRLLIRYSCLLVLKGGKVSEISEGHRALPLEPDRDQRSLVFLFSPIDSKNLVQVSSKRSKKMSKPQLKKMNLTSKQPRLPGLKTPATPTPVSSRPANGGGGDLVKSPPTPTPPPAASERALSNPGLSMDQLIIKGKKYTFSPDDLDEGGPVGAGNYGTVLKMTHRETDTQMAVKKIPVPELRINDKDNIVELAVVMETGTCPDIVQYYGCLFREGDVWICMELLDSSMDKIADRVYSQLGSTIPEDILGKMTVSVIRALNYLKADMKIIHRDVKPSNVLVNCLGQFKLCDFGIAGQLVDSIALTRDVGCRPYMAPERIDPSTAGKGYTIQSDVWSFGITLVELALGTFPYEKWTTIFEQLNAVVNGPAPKLPVNDRYSPELQEFAVACLIKDSTERPDYDRLQEYAFYKKYLTAEVAVATWLKSVGVVE